MFFNGCGVKVVDFGIVCVFEWMLFSVGGSATSVGGAFVGIVGTFAYMVLEFFYGDVDVVMIKCDVFFFFVFLWELFVWLIFWEWFVNYM